MKRKAEKWNSQKLQRKVMMEQMTQSITAVTKKPVEKLTNDGYLTLLSTTLADTNPEEMNCEWGGWCLCIRMNGEV